MNGKIHPPQRKPFMLRQALGNCSMRCSTSCIHAVEHERLTLLNLTALVTTSFRQAVNSNAYLIIKLAHPTTKPENHLDSFPTG
jgi:hypothetical protein